MIEHCSNTQVDLSDGLFYCNISNQRQLHISLGGRGSLLFTLDLLVIFSLPSNTVVR